MLVVALIAVCALPIQGELKMTLDKALYPAVDSGFVLELTYEIPNTSLMFTREGRGYAARYEIGMQVSDRRGDVVAGDIWQRSIEIADYGPTVARDSVEVGTVSITLPAAAARVRVEVSDRATERTASSRFDVARPAGGLVLRLLKGGVAGMSRRYGLSDTLQAIAEAMPGGPELDSCRFTVKSGRRVLTGAVTAAQDSGARRVCRFSYPVADSSGFARIGGGEYELEATAADGKLRAAVAFRIEVPFFYDDSQYFARVAQLEFAASGDEMQVLRRTPRAEREDAWRDFWKKRDQTPTTERNEREDEYFARIDYADEHFGHGDRGWRSDRGRVYVKYGAADQVDVRPFDIDAPAYEIWYYYEPNRKFVFVDRFGAGEMILQNPEVLNDR